MGIVIFTVIIFIGLVVYSTLLNYSYEILLFPVTWWLDNIMFVQFIYGNTIFHFLVFDF